MLPICFMKEAAKADSVWVRVSEARVGELRVDRLGDLERGVGVG